MQQLAAGFIRQFLVVPVGVGIVSADGQRFVVIRSLSERSYAVSVVQNWADAYRDSR